MGGFSNVILRAMVCPGTNATHKLFSCDYKAMQR